MRVEYTKWDGSLHWHFDVEHLGSDEHGLWVACHPGTALRRGSEPAKTEVGGFVTLVPAEGWWTAHFNRVEQPGDCEVYVDVTDQPRVYSGTVRAVDLDLDVIRFLDGPVVLADEDELEEHRVAYGYPDDVVEAVRATAAGLLEAVADRRPPFDTTPEAWMARLRPPLEHAPG